MRSERLFLLAALAGLATFAAALYFQYFEGLPPCKLCMWQRYGLGVGIFGALLGALLSGGGAIMGGAVGVLGYAAEAGAAVYHTGVERKWWPGPDTCSGNGGIGTSFDPALLGQSLTKGAPPQCDEIPWDFLGLSMANWNVAIATALALVCLIALRQRSSAAR